MPKIQFKRGTEANVPQLATGEPAFTTDTEKLFIGGANGNVEFPKKEDIDSLQDQVDSLEGELSETNQRFDELQLVDANAEVLAARGGETTLGNRLDKVSSDLAERATKTDLQNIGNASPKGTYATLTALQTAFPTGTTGLYIVTADNKWYFWNGSAWTAGGVYQPSLIDGTVTPIKTTFFNVNVSKNLVDPNGITRGVTIGAYGTDINVTSVSAGNNVSAVIDITGITDTSFISNVSNFSGLRYANSGGIVQGSVQGVSQGNGIYKVTIPSGMKYIRLTISDSDLNSVPYVYFAPLTDYQARGVEAFGQKVSYSESMNGLTEERLLEQPLKDKLKVIYRYTPTPKSFTGKVINYNGDLGTVGGFTVAEFELSLGETLTVSTYSITGDSSHWAMGEFFNDGSPLKKLYPAGDYTVTSMVHTSTKEKEFIRVMYSTSRGIVATVSLFQENLRTAAYKKIAIEQMSLLRYRYNSAICVGDSLTVGKQPADSSRENYPTFVAKMTGMTVTNAGQSGATAKSWWDTWQNTYNYSNYECAFIGLGTNGGIVQGSDNYNAYISLIDKMRADNPKIAIFLLDCVGNNSDGSNANDVIASIATLKNCAFLKVFTNDTYYLGGINQSAVTPTHDMSGDPTHLSPMGYLIMARNVVSEMCSAMANNMGLYNQRH